LYLRLSAEHREIKSENFWVIKIKKRKKSGFLIIVNKFSKVVCINMKSLIVFTCSAPQLRVRSSVVIKLYLSCQIRPHQASLITVILVLKIVLLLLFIIILSVLPRVLVKNVKLLNIGFDIFYVGNYFSVSLFPASLYS